MRWLRHVLCVLLVLFLDLVYAGDASTRPHIIIILGDDIGWNDFGYHGSNQIPTPNIDALGYNGVILDKFYTQQTCSPSRAALLTGNYPIRSGFQGTPIQAGENRSLPLDMPLLPERLKELGYKTHMVGKWHLGCGYKRNTPTQRGFDSHFGYWNGWIGYFDYMISVTLPDNVTRFNGLDLHEAFDPQWQYMGQYATDLFAKKSLDVIENHDTSDPLFLLVTQLAAHTGRDGVELGVPNITRTNQIYNYIANPQRRRYADIVNILDRSVGEIVDKLAQKDMLQNSIILFFSDNGAQTVGLYQNYGSNWPFRGLKFTLFEGGVRGSAVLYSPLLEKRGYINRQLIHVSDLLPTLYHAAGGDVRDLGNIDGINQWPSISQNVTTKRTEILLNIDEALNASAILGYEGRYKLVNGTYQNGVYDQYYGEDGRGPENPPYNIQLVLNSLVNRAIQTLPDHGPLFPQDIATTRRQLDISWCRANNFTPNFVCRGFCLFDIYQDPCETTNIIGNSENGNIVQNLQNRLSDFFTQLVPQGNRPIDPNSNPKRFNNTWWTWLEVPPAIPNIGFFGRIRNMFCDRWSYLFLIRFLRIC